VTALRERHKIPAMAVLQFGFGDPGAHIYLPHRLQHDCVIYTGTHDNDTTLGWWRTAGEYERRSVQALVGRDGNGEGINWALIRLAQSSVARLSVAPVQDVLGLGSEARLNTPSTPTGNYHWRYSHGALTREMAERLAHIAEVTDRLPQPAAAAGHEEFVA
jgi:4-alpha-glucanotransferase